MRIIVRQFGLGAMDITFAGLALYALFPEDARTGLSPIAFVGLFACLPIAWILRKGYGWQPSVIALAPWIVVGTHALFGIEPRYGLGSVAVCLVAAMTQPPQVES